MHKRLVLMALGTTFAFVFSNCSDKSVDSDPPQDTISIIDGDHFPNVVGSRWIYTVTNLGPDTMDTMTVEITDTVTLESGEAATIWVYACNNGVDTAFAYVEGDTVRTTEGSVDFCGMRISDRTLVTPFVVGAGWPGRFVRDTVFVLEQTSISTPIGVFTDAFVVRRRWSAYNLHGTHQSWYAPGVGLVKQIRQDLGFYTPGSDVWELVDYDIAE